MTTTAPSTDRLRFWFRGIAAGMLQLSVPLLVLALSPRPSRADLIYTWHETDAQVVTGSIVVSQQALTAGSISFADIQSFAFTIPPPNQNIPFVIGDNTSSFPFSITSTGTVTNPSPAQLTAGSNFASGPLDIPFNSSSFNPSNPVTWRYEGIPGSTGTGYWSVSITTAVPEPSSAVVAVFGALSGIAYVQVRKRRAQQRLGAGGQPQPTD